MQVLDFDINRKTNVLILIHGILKIHLKRKTCH